MDKAAAFLKMRYSGAYHMDKIAKSGECIPEDCISHAQFASVLFLQRVPYIHDTGTFFMQKGACLFFPIEIHKKMHALRLIYRLAC